MSTRSQMTTTTAEKKVFQSSLDDLAILKTTHITTPTDYTWLQHPVYLTETFYITSKKNTVFQVQLTGNGLILRKECNGATKEQHILLRDIIGCRCLRSKKRHPKNGKVSSSCVCSLPGSAQLKVVEANSGEQDESDTSAYLYIYAYIPKHSNSSNHSSDAIENKGNNDNGGKTKGHLDESRRDRTTITLRFRSFDTYEDNHQEAQKWRFTIKSLINKHIPSSPMEATEENIRSCLAMTDTRKVLVILNPKSGSGKARELFQQRVAPMLTEAELSYDLYVTKYANFARELVRTRDVYSWKSIVVVGGDGIYYEVLNGLCERPDWERALDEISIGIIPCGSGNGLAKTIAHMARVRFSLLEATLAIIRGRPTPMDVVRVETKNQTMFSFLSVGWGLIADIDIESERLRALGGPRFTIWSVHRLISLRTYKGKISYLPAEPNDMYKGGRRKSSSATVVDMRNRTALKHSKSCNAALVAGGDYKDEGTGDEAEEDTIDGGCEACDMMEFGDVLSLETSMSNGVFGRSRLDSFYSVGSRRSTYFSMAESVYQDAHDGHSVGPESVVGGPQTAGLNGNGGGPQANVPMYGPPSNIPALMAPVPSSWTVMEGEFVMAHLAYLSHLGADCYFAKQSKLNDGIIWLCVIKAGISRAQLLSFLLGLSSGTHIPDDNGHEYVKMIPCTAFRIEPAGTQGHLTVDGEAVEYGPIQGEVFEGLVNVTVPDVEGV